ncbi:Protein CROWDED NUCLEI 2, partial [Mucuna pruriens]
MFTPQGKAWPATSAFTPHRGGAATASASAKGKAIATDLPPPPPLGSLTETTVAVGFDAGNVEDWKKFTELGLLDEAVMQRKDQEALLEKVSRLERELMTDVLNFDIDIGIIAD